MAGNNIILENSKSIQSGGDIDDAGNQIDLQSSTLVQSAGGNINMVASGRFQKRADLRLRVHLERLPFRGI